MRCQGHVYKNMFEKKIVFQFEAPKILFFKSGVPDVVGGHPEDVGAGCVSLLGPKKIR